MSSDLSKKCTNTNGGTLSKIVKFANSNKVQNKRGELIENLYISYRSKLITFRGHKDLEKMSNGQTVNIND